MLELYIYYFFFFKQKTAYERRIIYWSADVCSSDLSTTTMRVNEVIITRIDGARLSTVMSAMSCTMRPVVVPAVSAPRSKVSAWAKAAAGLSSRDRKSGA